MPVLLQRNLFLWQHADNCCSENNLIIHMALEITTSQDDRLKFGERRVTRIDSGERFTLEYTVYVCVHTHSETEGKERHSIKFPLLSLLLIDLYREKVLRSTKMLKAQLAPQHYGSIRWSRSFQPCCFPFCAIVL